MIIFKLPSKSAFIRPSGALKRHGAKVMSLWKRQMEQPLARKYLA